MSDDRTPWQFHEAEETVVRHRGVYADAMRAFLDCGKPTVRVTLNDEVTGKPKSDKAVFAGLSKAKRTSPEEFSRVKIWRRSGEVFLTLVDE